MKLLNEVWKVCSKIEDPQVYMEVAEVYIEYPLKHLSPKEVNVLLADIVRHVSKDKAYERLQPQLQSIISKMTTYYSDFSLIYSMVASLLIDPRTNSYLSWTCFKASTQWRSTEPSSRTLRSTTVLPQTLWLSTQCLLLAKLSTTRSIA